MSAHESKPIIYLQMTDLDAFICELERRGITEVRQSGWQEIQGKYHEETLRARFTAWDPSECVILKIEIPYYRGFILRRDEEGKKKVDEGITKYVNPVIEKIERVATVENGEYQK